jgi:type II secretory pathway pseudopilin PulG
MVKAQNSKGGFTLLELTIISSILILLTSLFLADYRTGEREFSLLRSAHKVAQDLRGTQEKAMVGQKTPVTFGKIFPKGGYGIYFQEGQSSYILFADCDNDQEYDEVGAAISCAEANPTTPYPEKIEELFLEKGVEILSLAPASPLNITFFPPDPIITIKPSSNLAIIELVLGVKTKNILINLVGLIDIY